MNLFQFRVKTHKLNMAEVKLTKRYSDFMNLQDLVNDQALK